MSLRSMQSTTTQEPPTNVNRLSGARYVQGPLSSSPDMFCEVAPDTLSRSFL